MTEEEWTSGMMVADEQILAYRLGFQCPPTAADYVHRFVDTIMGFDYFTL